MYWMFALLDAYLLMNAIATIYIIKYGSLNAAEMVVQTLLVWLVPVIGVVMLIFIHWQESKLASKRPKNAAPN